MHAGNHRFERRLQSLKRILRIEVLDQSGRADDIGEQDRNVLELSFERATAVKNALREVRRREVRGLASDTTVSRGVRPLPLFKAALRYGWSTAIFE